MPVTWLFLKGNHNHRCNRFWVSDSNTFCNSNEEDTGNSVPVCMRVNILFTVISELGVKITAVGKDTHEISTETIKWLNVIWCVRTWLNGGNEGFTTLVVAYDLSV